MLWIKRNLFLVVGIVISVALLGGAGWYVYSNSEEDFARDEELEKLKTEITTIESGPMFPSEANIALVKSNTAQVLSYMAAGERVFGTEPVKVAGEAQLKVGLANLVDSLRREATNAGVQVPPKYEFTYGEVKVMPRLPAYALDPLTNQLKEVRSLCSILFNAKIQSLESLQRVPSFQGEPQGPDLLADRVTRTNSISTNLFVVTTPYRLVFRGFSGHLTEVLNGFASAKEFYAVRQVDVEPAGGMVDSPGMAIPGSMGVMPGAIPMVPNPGLPTPGLPTPGGASPPGMQPGGLRPPPTKVGVGVAAPPPPKSSLTKVLDEKPLRVTMILDVVKVVRKAPTPPAAPSPAPSAN